MSVKEVILKAAAKLPEEFTREELLLAAWQENPAALGLSGHEQSHPDSHKLYYTLYGEKGLLKRGLLAAASEGKLRLVPQEAEEALTALNAKQQYEEKFLGSLPSPGRLLRAYRSKAHRLFVEDKEGLIHYGHALQFWGCRDRDGAESFLELLGTSQEPVACVLRSLHRVLWEKFGQYLKA